MTRDSSDECNGRQGARPSLTDGFQLAVFELDAHALVHELNRDQQTSFLFASEDGPFITGKGAVADSDLLARLKSAFQSKGNAKVDQVADLTKVAHELGNVSDRCELLHAARADGVVSGFVIATQKDIVVKKWRVGGTNSACG